ncbi:hypothetical protein [Sodalis sp. RH20]|uniref:hypothetical protein n=1 Tax=unclassified Sodalis (in: enterobacteria) TaxID=2636512 RepID=UPI0039B6DBD1
MITNSIIHIPNVGIIQSGPAGNKTAKHQRVPVNLRNVPLRINSAGRRRSGSGQNTAPEEATVENCLSAHERASVKPCININDFERQYRQNSMNALFNCAGDQRETLAQLFQNSRSLLVPSHLEHIANAHFLARQLGPTEESAAKLDGIMHELTDMMLKDGLGEKSVFGGYRPEREAACVRRQSLEEELASLLNAIQGEGGAEAGARFINEKIKPFVVDYIVQETGSDGDVVQKEHIAQLVEKNAYQCFQNIRAGIQTYQASSLEKIFRDTDMILKLPNLLAALNLYKDHPPPLRTGLRSDAEQQTEATQQNDQSDSTDKTGATQKNRLMPSVEFNIKYAPRITIDASVKINWPPGTEKKEAGKTQSVDVRDNLQDIFEQLNQAPDAETRADVGSPPSFAKTHRPAARGSHYAQAALHAELISSRIHPPEHKQSIFSQPLSPGVGQNNDRSPAKRGVTVQEPANVLMNQGAEKISFTATTTQTPPKGTAHGIFPVQDTAQADKSGALYAAAKEVAEALGNLWESIPEPASSLYANPAPGNGRPDEGAISDLYDRARKRGATQKVTTHAVFAGQDAPQSAESSANNLTAEILRHARENLTPIPAPAAQSTKSSPMAAYLIEARNQLKATVTRSASASASVPAPENGRMKTDAPSVILSHQGARQANHPKNDHQAAQFAPLNHDRVNLAAARAGLSSTGYMPPLRQAQVNAGPGSSTPVPATRINKGKFADDE